MTIVYAAGSGGTGAGIELGLRLTGWGNARALGFAVCDDRAYFQRKIAALVEEASHRWALGVTLAPEQVAIDDRFIGPGYAKTTPALAAIIPQVARADGLVLDPVYTGKAFFGLTQTLAEEEGPTSRPARELRRATLVFIHTGGIFGLFPFAAELLAASP